jgi:2,4-dienoyl-CoA reductase-like NADH-dependent reductase (Old Yellow Enzyme family)
VAFGRAFVSNPDLVQRLADGIALRPCAEAVPAA